MVIHFSPKDLFLHLDSTCVIFRQKLITSLVSKGPAVHLALLEIHDVVRFSSILKDRLVSTVFITILNIIGLLL